MSSVVSARHDAWRSRRASQIGKITLGFAGLGRLPLIWNLPRRPGGTVLHDHSRTEQTTSAPSTAHHGLVAAALSRHNEVRQPSTEGNPLSLCNLNQKPPKRSRFDRNSVLRRASCRPAIVMLLAISAAYAPLAIRGGAEVARTVLFSHLTTFPAGRGRRSSRIYVPTGALEVENLNRQRRRSSSCSTLQPPMNLPLAGLELTRPSFFNGVPRGI